MINTGAYGELCAAHYLRKKKWEIRAANFHSRFGEIDLIAANKNYLIFVEVKTRDLNAIASPREFVDEIKQKKIIQTAAYYLTSHQENLQPRFDVIEVVTKENKMVRLHHIENAFELERN